MKKYNDGMGCFGALAVAIMTMLLFCSNPLGNDSAASVNQKKTAQKTVRPHNRLASDTVPMLVLNAYEHCYSRRALPSAHLEMVDVNGAPYSLCVLKKNVNAAIRQAVRGDTLMVERKLADDSVTQMNVLRNLTAERLARQFVKQK